MRASFCIGRFNPPTIGHEKMIECLTDDSKRNNSYPIIFVVDGKKSGKDLDRNPLSGECRKDILEHLYNIKVEVIPNAYNAFEVLESLGLTEGTLFCGNDRVKSYQSIITGGNFNYSLYPLDRNNLSITATDARNAAKQSFDYFKKFVSSKLDQIQVEQIRKMIIYPERFKNE